MPSISAYEGASGPFSGTFSQGSPHTGKSHHELEEEPGALQDHLTDCTATHHPLQSQLLMQQLWVGWGQQGPEATPPTPPSRRHDFLGATQSLAGGQSSRRPCRMRREQTPAPDGLWTSGRSAAPLCHRADIRHPLYLLYSVSWLRGWQGRGGGLDVRGGAARAAVDGLGWDGMESMGWQNELVMWMGNRDEATWMEEGSVHAGIGKERDGSCRHEQKKNLCYGLNTSPETPFTC